MSDSEADAADTAQESQAIEPPQSAALHTVGGESSHPAPVTQRQTVDDILANVRRTRLPYRERKNEHKLQRRVDEHALRKKVAKWSYIGLATQIVIADGVFVGYAWAGRQWDLPVAAISVWLSATVVQVIAVLLVITRYLFPDRGKRGQ